MAHSFIGLPPDSTGKKLHAHSHDVNGEIVHNQIFTLGDGEIADNLQHVDEYGAATVKFAGGGMEFDAFGKAKMSQETTIGNYVNEFDEGGDEWDLVENGTTLFTYLPNEKSIRMGVDIGNGDKVTRTTKRYHKYTAGTSQYVLMTLNPGMFKENVRKRWGYFDDNNGVFFEQHYMNNGIVLRTNTTGVPVDTYVDRADFNGDKLDGTGTSGIAMDPTKSNIFWFDFQWLGVGAVRFGLFGPEGQRILVHTFENANAKNTVYMESANLPVRFEIENIGIPASATEMKVHNSAVIAESRLTYFGGRMFSASAGMLAPVTVNNVETAILNFRQKSLFNGKVNNSAAMPKVLSIYTDKPMIVTIQKGVGFTGDGTYMDSDSVSTVEWSADQVYNIGGSKLFGALVDTGVTRLDLTDAFDYLNEYLARGTDANDYTVIMRCINDLDEATVVLGLQWEEMRMA